MPATDDVPLTRRMFLLACDPERQRLAGREYLGLVLNAAALQELYDDGLLADDDGRPRTSGARGAAPRSALAAAVHRRIAEDPKPRPWRYWVKKAERAAVGTVRDELLGERLIRVQHRRVLLVLRFESVQLRQPRLRTAVLGGVRDALRPAQPASRVPHGDAAAAVFAHIGEMRPVMSRAERRAARPRIAELEPRLGPVPAALRRTVKDKKSDVGGAA
ncbi:GOLPH3/VPS74 family protein [Yinghuangia soli]|uniref:GPP34 family phosphoprotein n=1 Tax=Yinghuangia soli TaxID=2908204 RepID=A0AA41Q1R1_9ACTN|nr:GPP34 family phosphoprotein [Yinghuangia soli]MCF2529973.1 GPP34 family phosphoprotein [Yinghuangia soli]